MCDEGWRGENCDQDIDECQENPDVCNDTMKECVNGDGFYSCVCAEGFVTSANGICEGVFTEFLVVSIEHLRRVWHADRGRLLLRTPGPVPLGHTYVLLVETNPFPNSSLLYRTMLFEYPSVLLRFCLAYVHYCDHT